MDSLEKDLSQEEIHRLGEALKEKEFKDLLFDYMKEISDPDNKKKYEEEIEKLEKERGNKITWLKSTSIFCLKLFTTENDKIFVNICSSKHIEPAHPGKKKNSEKMGTCWQIPYSLNQLRDDMDNDKKECKVTDCIFHDDTLYQAQKSEQFRKLLIETVQDAVHSQLCVQLKKDYKILKRKSKGEPQNTVLRTKLKENSENIEFLNQLEEKSKRSNQKKNLVTEISPSQKEALIKEFSQSKNDDLIKVVSSKKL